MATIFPNLDNEQDNLKSFLNELATIIGETPTQGSAISDPAAAAALTTDLTGVDTGTDMTAAQAAQIEADLAALKTAIDANNAAIDTIISRLEAFGIVAS